ncbi:MAG TPA: PepSY-like domain-containing protein [Ohtaekwangia sp.]|nr:PepSY-like domain-containing protein [Ohtaekwangia sp.]
MKTLMFSILAATISTAAVAQDIPQSDVPSLVLNTFQSKYEKATDLEWEKKGDLYKAEFEIGTREHDLWIDAKGQVTKHKEDFPKAELPAAIRQKIESEFKDYTIEDVDKIEEDGKVLYLVDLDGKTGDRDVFFNEDGTVLK